MTQQFTAQYFLEALNAGPNQVRQASLTDTDLIRDNGDAEVVTDSEGTTEIFNGFFTIRGAAPPVPTQTRTDFTGEVSLTVTFNDGTSLDNVLALRDFEVNTGTDIPGFIQGFNSILFDQAALASVGKTVADVVDVSRFVNVDHDLTWAELGFTAGEAPVVEPVTVANVVEGRSFNERLRGTNEDDVIIGNGGDDRLIGRDGNDVLLGGSGNDRLVGGEGEDTFIFGGEARNGNRERDVIVDFDASEDTIIFGEDVVIRTAFERGDNVVIRLEGDNDAIVIRDADLSVLETIQFSDDPLLF